MISSATCSLPSVARLVAQFEETIRPAASNANQTMGLRSVQQVTGSGVNIRKANVPSIDGPGERSERRAMLGNGLTRLIEHAIRRLRQVRSDARRNVVSKGSRDSAALRKVRGDNGIVVDFLRAIIKARRLNNDGRHVEALVALKDAPEYTDIMKHGIEVPRGPEPKAYRILQANECRRGYSYNALVTGRDDKPHGVLDQQGVCKHRIPDKLRIPALIDLVAWELYSFGAYDDAIVTWLPPPPIA